MGFHDNLAIAIAIVGKPHRPTKLTYFIAVWGSFQSLDLSMDSPFTSFARRANDIAVRTARLQRLVNAILHDLESSDEEEDPIMQHEPVSPEWRVYEDDDLQMYEDGSEVSVGSDFLMSRPATPAPPMEMELVSEETLSPILAPPVVRFADEVEIIRTPERRRRIPLATILFNTPRQNYTPWWYEADQDYLGNCSDSETVVDEYEEVCTPVPQGRVFVDDTTEDEESKEDELYLE